MFATYYLISYLPLSTYLINDHSYLVTYSTYYNIDFSPYSYIPSYRLLTWNPILPILSSTYHFCEKL